MYRTRNLTLPRIHGLQSALNQVFDDALDDIAGSSGSRERAWGPPVEVFENKEELVFLVELPGFEKKEVDLSFEDGNLTISGERKAPKEGERNYHRNERFYGKFERSFQLPAFIDAEKIAASLEMGILKIQIPKREEAKARQISVKVG